MDIDYQPSLAVNTIIEVMKTVCANVRRHGFETYSKWLVEYVLMMSLLIFLKNVWNQLF